MFKKWYLILIAVFIGVNFIAGLASAGNDIDLFDKANNYLEAGQDDFAIMSFRELVRDYPNSLYCDEAKFRLGEYYYKQNNPNEAIKILSQHSRLYPDSSFKEKTKGYLIKLNSDILIKKANELFAEKRWDEALQAYTQLTSYNTQDWS